MPKYLILYLGESSQETLIKMSEIVREKKTKNITFLNNIVLPWYSN